MSRSWAAGVSVIAFVMVAVAGGAVYALLRYKLYYAPSDSMAPTVRTHQIFVGDRFAYRTAPPARDDVLLFMPPLAFPDPLFKRVVAVPGDRLAIRGGREILNGTPVAERYRLVRGEYELAVRDYGISVDGVPLSVDGGAVVPPRADWTASDTVPRGCYVVLGDNRPNSVDSHVFGFLCPGRPVPRQPGRDVALIGRALVP